jgi:hypothetical protein
MRRGCGYWQPALAKGIDEADAFVLLVGEKSLGPWQTLEYYGAQGANHAPQTRQRACSLMMPSRNLGWRWNAVRGEPVNRLRTRAYSPSPPQDVDVTASRDRVKETTSDDLASIYGPGSLEAHRSVRYNIREIEQNRAQMSLLPEQMQQQSALAAAQVNDCVDLRKVIDRGEPGIPSRRVLDHQLVEEGANFGVA